MNASAIKAMPSAILNFYRSDEKKGDETGKTQIRRQLPFDYTPPYLFTRWEFRNLRDGYQR